MKGELPRLYTASKAKRRDTNLSLPGSEFELLTIMDI